MRRLALLVAVSSVAALSGLNVPADAAKNGGRPDEHRRIVKYWTPERQAHAIPRDMSPNPKAKPGSGGSGSGAVTGATWTLGGDVSMTTGKVFFTLGGLDYVCSGSAVDSAHGSLVLSAGHCVHDGDGGPFATNWLFKPRWNGAIDPVLGNWTAKELHTTAGWANPWSSSGSGYNDDAGFAVVTNGSSATLEQVLTGADATIPTVAFDGHSNTATYSAFGYPAARPYRGNTLTYCAGTTRLDRDALDTMALACNMTGGSSGGPWFVDYAPAGGPRVIESVNSYGYPSIKATMFGPIFGQPELDAYNAASAAGCAASRTTACL